MVSPERGVWLALFPAMTLPFAAALFYFVLLKESEMARWLYAATKIFTVVWPIAAAWLLTEIDFPKFRLSDPLHRRAVPLGFVTGIAIVGLMGGLMLTPIGEMVAGSAPQIRGKAQGLGILNHYWAFGLFLSVIHSLIEEYYWRWFVFGQLRKVIPKFAAHILAGASFAAHHVVIATQYFTIGWGLALGGMVGMGGILWSLMYERQRSLAGAWVSHMIADLGILSLGHRLIFGTFFF